LFITPFFKTPCPLKGVPELHIHDFSPLQGVGGKKSGNRILVYYDSVIIKPFSSFEGYKLK
jgi:hypothetical protein